MLVSHRCERNTQKHSLKESCLFQFMISELSAHSPWLPGPGPVVGQDMVVRTHGGHDLSHGRQ